MATTMRDVPQAASDVEHLLWPAKILGCGIPTYVVPIRPRWATDLFDTGMADDMLWGDGPGIEPGVRLLSCRPT